MLPTANDDDALSPYASPPSSPPALRSESERVSGDIIALAPPPPPPWCGDMGGSAAVAMLTCGASVERREDPACRVGSGRVVPYRVVSWAVSGPSPRDAHEE